MVDVTRAKIEDLIPDAGNANLGTDRGREMLEHSLRSFGAGRSVLLDKKGRIIAGNKTVAAAMSIGLDDVEVIHTNGTKLVAVQRDDLDLMADDEARLLAYADNRTTDISLEWSPAQVKLDLDTGLDISAMFDDGEISEILAGLTAGGPEDPGPQIDKAEALQEKWRVERGQIWEVPSKAVPGKCHRVMCGDSTDAGDVQRLMDGEKASAVVTDPPYGMNLDTDYSGISRNWKGRVPFAQSKKYELVIGDSEAYDPSFLLAYFEDCPEMFLWGGDYYVNRLPLGGSWLVWDKTEGHSQQVVGSEFELCWSKKKHRRTILAHKWAGVMGLQSQDIKERLHPTQKPLEVIIWIIERYTSERDIIADFYLGSGTTLVACEKTARIGYGMEIAEKYVAVCLERLSGLGLEPVLL